MLFKVGSQLQIVNPLNKTASSIKEASTSFITPKDDNFTYFQCIAVHADVPNMNADIFPLDELKSAYKTFIGRGLYMDHNANSVANAVGKIFDAKLIQLPNASEEEGKYGVLCLCGVDKTTHPDIAAKVAHGVIDSVSMGANVTTAVCNTCGCVAHTPEEFCVHLQHQGQIDPETGKKCCSINRGVNFTELSLVGVPADPYAKMQQVFADFVGGLKKQAELPEKKWNEKFSFNIPCGNDKICEMLYNLLSSYEKQGILDLSKDGPVLKLSVEAGSKEEALQKLEYISKEQGFGVKEPLKKDTEENLMTKDNKEVKEEVKATASLKRKAKDVTDEAINEMIDIKETEESTADVDSLKDGDTHPDQEFTPGEDAEVTIEEIDDGNSYFITQNGRPAKVIAIIEQTPDKESRDAEYSRINEEYSENFPNGSGMGAEYAYEDYIQQNTFITSKCIDLTKGSIFYIGWDNNWYTKVISDPLEDQYMSFKDLEAEFPGIVDPMWENMKEYKNTNKNASAKYGLNKKAVDTKIKDYQRQTKDFQGEPIEAPEEVKNSLDKVNDLRIQISEKEVQLAKVTQEIGINELNEELQTVLNGAADSLKNLQGKVLRYGKQLITYQNEIKTQEFKPTITWIKEKLAKYPEALAYIEAAINGAQNMAKQTETSTIKVYNPDNK